MQFRHRCWAGFGPKTIRPIDLWAIKTELVFRCAVSLPQLIFMSAGYVKGGPRYLCFQKFYLFPEHIALVQKQNILRKKKNLKSLYSTYHLTTYALEVETIILIIIIVFGLNFMIINHIME